MEQASPARLYATLIGAVLVVAGIVGFFYSSSFGAPGVVGEELGIFAVNGWLNVFHVASGATGLLVAGFAARRYALLLGLAYVAIAIWGFAIGSGEPILGFLPVDVADNLLHLVLGVLGIGAAVATAADAARPAPAT